MSGIQRNAILSLAGRIAWVPLYNIGRRSTPTINTVRAADGGEIVTNKAGTADDLIGSVCRKRRSPLEDSAPNRLDKKSGNNDAAW
tara:strand:- start:12929 stop:13186 length:258 start_codon:yes stop_codon:yes gene_type:complete